MLLVDIFKAVMYLEQQEESEYFLENLGLQCANCTLTHLDAKYDPIAIANLNYEEIKNRWDVLSGIYNLPYTCILHASNYIDEVLRDKHASIVYENEIPGSGVHELLLRYSGRLLRMMTIDGRVTVVSDYDRIPFTMALSIDSMNSVKVWYKDYALHMRKGRSGESPSMVVYYSEDCTGDVMKLLSEDLCVVMRDGAVATVPSHSVASDPYNSDYTYKDIQRILQDNNNLEVRYKKIIEALQCMSHDAPDRLNAILGSLPIEEGY